MKPKKGDTWICVRDVVMNGNPENIAYRKGKLYYSDIDLTITDDNGNKYHYWDIEDAVIYKYFRRVPKNKKSRYARST